VIAANDDDLWNEAGAITPFYLKPYFYQTGWFYLFCCAVLLIAGTGLHRLRLKNVRREFKAVLSERTRIAREIHDGLVQSLAGVVLQLETGQLSSQDSAQRHFARALDLARKGVQEARRAIDNLRPENGGTHSELPDAIRSMAEQRLQHSGMSLQFDVIGEPTPLSETLQSELLRICQEALQNVLKHSGAQLVHIYMEYENRLLRLSIKDDGKGFEQNAASQRGHFGLIGMRERAEKIGADLKIQSASGQGSLIQICVRKTKD
jgi:Signal transduction histidine kinase